jgi:hypothetical protein
MLRALTPAERVVLAFVGYAALLMAALGVASLKLTAVPRDDFVAALLVVFVLRMALRDRATAPAERSAAEKFHRFTLPLFLLPVGMLLLPGQLPTAPADGGAAVRFVLTAVDWTKRVIFLGAPGVLFWFAAGFQIRDKGSLDTRALIAGSVKPALLALRDWAPPVVLMYLYGLMGPILAKPLFADRDMAVAAIDRALFFGHDPVLLCERLVHPALSEWLAGCYVAYGMLFPLVLGAIYADPEIKRFREVAFACTLALAIGYVGYTLVPVQGPLFTMKFGVNLDVYYVGWLKEQLMDRTRVPRDCFPSLHTCMSILFLWSAYRHTRRLFWVLLPIVGSIPIACVYLRYHFVTDVLAGIGLFLFVRWVTLRSSVAAS